MSRFLCTANASDSSPSEPEPEDEDESDDEGAAHKEAKPKPRFLCDSDEEVKWVVKSARDKRLEETEATGNALDNALKINDRIAISRGKSLIHMYVCLLRVAHLRGLLLEYDKLIHMVECQQNAAEPVPPFYIRTLILLEVALNAALAKVAFSPASSRWPSNHDGAPRWSSSSCSRCASFGALGMSRLHLGSSSGLTRPSPLTPVEGSNGLSAQTSTLSMSTVDDDDGKSIGQDGDPPRGQVARPQRRTASFGTDLDLTCSLDFPLAVTYRCRH
jgi:hypothetical protein